MLTGIFFILVAIIIFFCNFGSYSSNYDSDTLVYLGYVCGAIFMIGGPITIWLCLISQSLDRIEKALKPDPVTENNQITKNDE